MRHSRRTLEYSTRTYAVEADTSTEAAAMLEPWKRWSPFEAAFINEHLKDLKPGARTWLQKLMDSKE